MDVSSKILLIGKLVSYRDECHNELRQNMCYSLVVVLVTWYCPGFLDEKFIQGFHYFCKMLLGCKIFRLLYFYLGQPCHKLVCLYSCRKFFRIRKAFLNFGFKNWFGVFACYFGFRVNLKTC